ncbi:MAG TPA: metalloregulator ArsR/SmtB family transcription factor [Nitrospirota bacterium]|nr:metalloregulator ArsR/SmtB family transcription factor [Nitrospirota bacterium]
MEELISVFKALSDETRLRIIKLLEQGELCVCDIVAALDIIQPKASFHLGALRASGLIKDRKQGKWTHYSLNEADLFRRMLMVTICEKADGSMVEADRKRLAAFLKSKKTGSDRDKAKRINCSCEA